MNFRKTLLVAGLATAFAVPFVAKAAIDLTINVGADDQAHFDFNGGQAHHDALIWRAAQKLQAAKHDLWKARNDYHGHKADAIGAINGALDQLSICERR